MPLMSLSALVAQLSSLVKGILVLVLWASLDSLMLMLVRMLSVLVMVVWITLGGVRVDDRAYA